jgi:hypothetical protein
MLVPVDMPMGELIEPDDEGETERVYPHSSVRTLDDTDHLFWEGVSPPASENGSGRRIADVKFDKV